MDEKSIVQEITRERFKWERKCLGPFAFQSKFACREKDAKDRLSGSMPDLRNPFAHDTDRIIHSNSYARYMDKTQVFFQIKNDHITRRSLHVQMVSRIARTIGRCLALNEDLIEAIAVGHDIGHTPFGHAGEKLFWMEFWDTTENYPNRNSSMIIQDYHGINSMVIWINALGSRSMMRR